METEKKISLVHFDALFFFNGKVEGVKVFQVFLAGKVIQIREAHSGSSALRKSAMAG